jgi:hypothetical protein
MTGQVDCAFPPSKIPVFELLEIQRTAAGNKPNSWWARAQRNKEVFGEKLPTVTGVMEKTSMTAQQKSSHRSNGEDIHDSSTEIESQE